ncbi:MAG: right-handed parallel beta-helix repeat-containing protein, partial [Bacteroidota bacterium]
MLSRCILLAASVLLAVPASAQTTFTVTTAASGGPGSLRQAIQSANAEPNGAAPDTIAFDLSGTGPFTIRPTSELPLITEAVVIDGLSQPGADCSTWPATLLVEIDGSLAGSESDGLLFGNGGGSTVRGVVINRFGNDGVDVEGDGGNTFTCNYVGTDPTGMIARPNGGDGFDIDSSDNVVGGPTPSDRNLISGNGNPGSLVGDGVDIDGDSSEPGTGERNVVQGNYIGVAVDGVTPLGNGDDGVEVQDDARDNVIGGTTAGEGNVIGFNGDNGVQVEDAGTIRNAILGNAIFGNRGRGIELQVSSGGEQTP